MKKILSLLLIAVLCVSACSFVVSASGSDLTFTITADESISFGDTTTVKVLAPATVSKAGYAGINAFEVAITFDNTNFALVPYANDADYLGAVGAAFDQAVINVADANSDGVIYVAFASAEPVAITAKATLELIKFDLEVITEDETTDVISAEFTNVGAYEGGATVWYTTECGDATVELNAAGQVAVGTRGDFDNNGTLDLAEVAIMLQLFKNPNYEVTDDIRLLADFDNSGVIDLAEVALALQRFKNPAYEQSYFTEIIYRNN